MTIFDQANDKTSNSLEMTKLNCQLRNSATSAPMGYTNVFIIQNKKQNI